MALDSVTCSLGTGETVESTSNDVNSAFNDPKPSKSEQLYEIDANADVLQQDANDEEYEDTNQYKFEPTVQPVVTNQLTIVNMPVESLPCPRELVRSGEDSLMLSSKDESFWQPNASTQILPKLFFILTLLSISVF